MEPVTDEEARSALHEYEEIQDTIREFEDEKRWVVERLRAWLGQRGCGQGQARRAGEDPLRGHGPHHPLLGGLQAAQQPAGPGDPLGDRNRERLRVPAGQLDAPQGERRTGPLPSIGAAPLTFNRARQGPRHTI